MARLRVALLAAGRGIRMGGEIPKTLIPVREREPLLYYLLQGLKAAGVEDLLVVTGFRPIDLEEYVTKEWGDATFVRNARYASWGNFNSVRVALDQSPGFEVMVVNSDIVVHPKVYERVRSTPGDLVLAVERRTRLDPEDMRVDLREGNRVRGIGKDLKMAHSSGEYCGVSLLRGTALRVYADIATELEWTGQTDVYYEDVYARMLERVDARAATVLPGEYAEVDVPADLDAASRVIGALAAEWAGQRA